MGGNTSLMTKERLQDYIELTYLNKSEIMSLYNKFNELKYPYDENIFQRRVEFEEICTILPQIKCNPFADRIRWVFSSLKDDRFSFEDLLDFCSVMSENCPTNVKALWAFRIFDFKDERALNKDDFIEIIDRLTYIDRKAFKNQMKNQQIIDDDKKRIIDILLEAMDIEQNGSIGPLEFEHAIGKMSDFGNSFTFRI
ncbi:calcium and integrin-binding protein 1-like [Onthophagus taurus]|uniref:calcium and integrin-binding protein 1-like n=1 Tax=Onthophagus taurus TaxID=166361 RepID=UPI0039BEAC0D